VNSQRVGPGRFRWARWAVVALAALILGVSGTGWMALRGIDRAVGRVDAFRGLQNRPSDRSLDFLLVGTDEREGISKEVLRRLHAGGASCHCTDTILLVHLAEGGDRATVVSIPRDSYLTIPAHRDRYTGKRQPAAKGKANAAYGMGGPALTVDTVERATGIRIDHYLQVNFLSFISTVDTLGGVEVCTNTPLHDPKSGLDLPAGTSTLDGATALRYVRSRYVDASSDLGRMERQQKFLAQLLARLRSRGTLLDPGKVRDLVGTVLKSVKADKDLHAQDMIRIGTGLDGLSPNRTAFTTVPAADADYRVPGWGSVLRWDRPAAKRLFAAIRADRTPGGSKPSEASSARPNRSPTPSSTPRIRKGSAVVCGAGRHH
jgi:LCP family protein required for cell wall assembly